MNSVAKLKKKSVSINNNQFYQTEASQTSTTVDFKSSKHWIQGKQQKEWKPTRFI